MDIKLICFRCAQKLRRVNFQLAKDNEDIESLTFDLNKKRYHCQIS